MVGCDLGILLSRLQHACEPSRLPGEAPLLIALQAYHSIFLNEGNVQLIGVHSFVGLPTIVPH